MPVSQKLLCISASFFVTLENVCFPQAGDKEILLLHLKDRRRKKARCGDRGEGQVFAAWDCTQEKSRNSGSEAKSSRYLQALIRLMKRSVCPKTLLRLGVNCKNV